MAKNQLKNFLLRLKENCQEGLFQYPPNKTAFVRPKPIYISQLGGAEKTKITKLYGKINDRAAAKRFGAKNQKEFNFWAWRSCGIVCLQMVIETLTQKTLKTMDLINQALGKNGYVFNNDLGWRHQALIALAQDYGLKAQILRLATIYDLAQAINKNKYVIASLTSPSGGHLCLFFGFKTNQDGQIDHFYYHNPSDHTQNGTNLTITAKSFEPIFQHKAIAIWKQN